MTGEQSAETLKQLIAQRGVIKGRVTRFRNFISKCDDITQIKLRLEKFQDVLPEFVKIQTEIDVIDQTKDHNEDWLDFEENYYQLLSHAQNQIKHADIIDNKSDMQNPSKFNSFSSIALPAIKLPIFSGEYQNWSSFSDSFKSLVHNNPNLSDCQKFHYLKLSLKDSAANVLQSLESSNDSYKIAWDLLVERFQNKRYLVNKHVSALFNLNKCVKESSVHLRNLTDDVQKHLRALNSLGQPTDQWDTLIIHIIINHLDSNTHRQWESEIKSDDVPKLSELMKFLQKRCQVLETVESKSLQFQVSKQPNVSNFQSKFKANLKNNVSTSNYVSAKKKCLLCDKFHPLYFCDNFKSLSVSDREKEVRNLGLCFNCLSSCDHKTKDCKASSCKLCSKRHNTLLHYSEKSNDIASSNSSSLNADGNHNHQKQSVASISHISSRNVSTSILLSTAVVKILDNQGTPHLCRILLDSGSQSNFITEKVVKKLGLPTSKTSVEVNGIGKSSTKTSGIAQCVIQSRQSSYSSAIECVVLRSITSKLPSMFIKESDYKIPPNFQLADPQFNQPSEIDLLVGAELFFDLLCDGRCKITDSELILKNLVFGWIISGKVQIYRQVTNLSITCGLSTLEDINRNIQRFWDIEQCKDEKKFTGNDKFCEDFFEKTTTRDETGRYCVQIPLKDEINKLGSSKDIAFRRFMSLEKRLSINPDLHLDYVKFMREYEQLGHMQEITQESSESTEGYFIPHHCVIKKDSSTTKLRVVFDASAKSDSGVSLNDISCVGPTVQSDLISIIVRFRSHSFVMTADIEKMYRQIKVHPSQQNLQMILWRESSEDPVKTFKLSTVTYGTASAPYLATRTLKQLAMDEQIDLPTASKVVINDFYVDDVMTGCETIQEAKCLRRALSEITRRGGFHLRKWSSNHPDILSDIPIEDTLQELFNIDQDTTVKALGLVWNPKQDTFQFVINNPSVNQITTKRSILSAIGRIFDPLGLIGPVILVAKLIMQSLWSHQISWDEKVPDKLLSRWNQFQNSLHLLSNLRVPRAIFPRETTIVSVEIHGFSDASESAYGACLYARSVDINGNVLVNLITSKSRVAPLKKISLPRLELCGALLLSELCNTVISSLRMQINLIRYYTDSTVTLAWIRAPTSHWTTFVANRVSKIQDNSDVNSWRHVKGEENPADYLSRGLLPSELFKADLYWNGPLFLHETSIDLEDNFNLPDEESIPERRLTACANVTTEISGIKFNDFSSLIRAQRVISFCLRFIHNCRFKQSRLSGPLGVNELDTAEQVIIRIVQSDSFSIELKALKSNKFVDNNSKLKSLNPFLDEHNIIRVGGRLQNSELHSDQIHPILLPAKHVVTDLIVKHFHIKALHAGPQLLLNVIRQKYWPINGRNLCKRIFHQCVMCFRTNPKHQTQIMGNLPQSRVQIPVRPFITTGVDYCGPFLVKMSKRRGVTPVKGYVSLFICFSTKAVHLELVEDLTTGSFIAALHRFISRRGKPQDIYSDNGTNFVGANRELQELLDLCKSEKFQSEVTTALSLEGIAWHFQPPRAPHFGGLWESSVKLVKTHLKRVIGKSILTYVQFNTLLTQIEACINSRPLTPLSNEPTDLCPLTPSHFLIGDILTKNPEPSLTGIPENKLSHWQQIQQMLQHFWSRWSRDYLNGLQQRRKWMKSSPDPDIDDLVLIKEDNLPPLSWKLGRIVKLHPGQDNKTRVVSLRTASGILSRAISKICLLPRCQQKD